MSFTFNREMQIRREELLRELPKAVGNREHEVTDNQIRVRDGDKRVTIEMIEEPTAHRGSLDLPMMQLNFEFEGYSEAEVEDFMTTFDHHTLRFGAV